MSKKTTDMSPELVVYRHANGIKLVKRESTDNTQFQSYSIADLLRLPFPVYFLNISSVFQLSNDWSIETCGFNSLTDAQGSTVERVSRKETAKFSMNHDQMVIQSNEIKILEEHYSRLDEVDSHGIVIKFPWYNQDNKIIGVLGCTLLMSEPQSFAESFALITKTGLLNTNLNILSGLQTPELYFTQREKDILHLLVRGKSAKEIGNKLFISSRTVEHHLNNIKLKLNVNTKSEVIEKMFDYFKLI